MVAQSPEHSGSNWNLGVLVFRRGENQNTRRKTGSWSRDENQQQTRDDSTHMITWSRGIEPQVTLVGASSLTTTPSLLLTDRFLTALGMIKSVFSLIDSVCVGGYFTVYMCFYQLTKALVSKRNCSDIINYALSKG